MSGKFDSVVKHASNMMLRQCAEAFTKQMDQDYQNIITAFYNDYDPWFYQRTEATRYGSSAYGKNCGSALSKPFGSGTDGGYEGGITVSASNVSSGWGGNPYRADTAWVFNRTFVKGIHGLTTYDIKNFNSTERKKATARWKKQGEGFYDNGYPMFDYQKFMNSYTRISNHIPTSKLGMRHGGIHTMNPTPYECMQTAYDYRSSDDNLNKLVEKYYNAENLVGRLIDYF